VEGAQTGLPNRGGADWIRGLSPPCFRTPDLDIFRVHYMTVLRAQ